ncbi:Band 4.1 domain-containing protein [Heterostelium album PN500]|uniref:Band 4.1 domain-containing protein n=1 Tax=Heterostelium pallidum (strain ATCC 26659 / Pp 5 / PN500) TaxID=670386 RepID=D3BUX3_HETP5|nr:Band 4.1 domain-containing protein [Heterostelium album PN500]EFA74911.1 Band 4.1 domain-containing protein [Heterostelium album PN500]|eukprot:XP_020427045.1 Band 4.1 domain-containing protein [Heterostelium album PN500]
MSGSTSNSGQLMVRVYFIDDTHRTLMIDPNTVTGDKLWEMVSDKLAIKNKDAECFFVWAQSDEIEWLLYNHQTMQEVINGWDVIRKRYVEQPGSNESSPNNMSPRSTGPVGTLRGKIASLSPTLRSKSSANLNSSVSQADLNGADGKKTGQIVSSFPTLGDKAQFKLVYRATSVLPLAQERSIISPEAYLETCQRWVYYGSTFFKAKYIPSTTSFFLQEFEGKVRLGVNGYGVHIIDPKAMKIVSYHYRDIVCWDSTESSFTIQFLITTGSKQQQSKKAYIFKTQQGELINDLMHDWMAEWEHEVKKEKQNTSGAPAGSATGLNSSAKSSSSSVYS